MTAGALYPVRVTASDGKVRGAVLVPATSAEEAERRAVEPWRTSGDATAFTLALPLFVRHPVAGTQAAQVLEWLQRVGSITPRDAMEFGCYRLAARILDLRAMGWAIATEAEPHEGGTHARYRFQGARP